MQRVSGFADRKPVTADSSAIRNNRLEIILLRKDSEGAYEYRQTVVYKSLQKGPTTPWRRDDSGVLFVTAA